MSAENFKEKSFSRTILLGTAGMIKIRVFSNEWSHCRTKVCQERHFSVFFQKDFSSISALVMPIAAKNIGQKYLKM